MTPCVWPKRVGWVGPGELLGEMSLLSDSPRRHTVLATRDTVVAEVPFEALDRLDDPQLRARARHVISENQRVRRAAEALVSDDLATVGAAMKASHASLRDDFDVSTPTLNALVERLQDTPGVHGARLTGAAA